jgi:hypothetical protein
LLHPSNVQPLCDRAGYWVYLGSNTPRLGLFPPTGERSVEKSECGEVDKAEYDSLANLQGLPHTAFVQTKIHP